jgi:hypothetical protein
MACAKKFLHGRGDRKSLTGLSQTRIVAHGYLKYCSELLTSHIFRCALIYAALLLRLTIIVGDEIYSNIEEDWRIRP